MTQTLRIAVRKFGPFETAIVKQFADFVAATGADAALEAVAMDLNPLHQVVIGDRGLTTGDWDIAFMATDWLAEAQADGLLEDLSPHLARAPIADFPDAWSPSLTTMQRFAGGFWGMPYHDGPECLVYRRDLLDAAGIAVPTTWDEFHAAARALHRPEQEGTTASTISASISGRATASLSTLRTAPPSPRPRRMRRSTSCAASPPIPARSPRAPAIWTASNRGCSSPRARSR